MSYLMYRWGAFDRGYTFEVEFNSLIDGYIERTATGYGEMSAELFLDLLVERMEARADETVNLSIDVREGDDRF